MSPCRCGHDAAVHEHYRARRDCSMCQCAAFSRPPGRKPVEVVRVLCRAVLARWMSTGRHREKDIR